MDELDKKLIAKGYVEYAPGMWYNPKPRDPAVRPDPDHPHARWEAERDQQDSLYAMKNSSSHKWC